MKQIAILLSIFLYVTPCLAQSYLTYTVIGDVKANAKKLSTGDQLTDKAVLTIGANSKVVLLSELDKTMITIKSMGTGTISSMISKEGNKKNSVTSDYIAFVKKKVTSDNGGKDVNYMQAAGTSYRGIRPKYNPLPKAENGKLLDPLRTACNEAIMAFKSNNINGLEKAANTLESLGLCRFDFDLLSSYNPRSFNGQFVLDPLCLRDLALSLDPSAKFAEQIINLPTPITSTTRNIDVEGNILVNYYYLNPGEQITIGIECIGYCETAIISLNSGIKSSFNGQSTNFMNFKNVVPAKIVISNPTSKPATILFAINAE